jgi:hypothetical protein
MLDNLGKMNVVVVAGVRRVGSPLITYLIVK